jgi:hypothetical protein
MFAYVKGSAEMRYWSKLNQMSVKVLGGALAMLVVGMYCSSALAGSMGELPSGCSGRNVQCLPNYAVTYYSNNTPGLPDESVRVVNTGLIGDPLNPNGDADICVNFYVFDAGQELSECCSCLETADALLVASVQNDLTANPLTGVHNKAGVIKITATFPTSSGCSPTSYGILPTNEVMAGFGSHLQAATLGVSPTETNLINRPLSWNELNSLQSSCDFAANVLGSGQGVCTCPTLK